MTTRGLFSLDQNGGTVDAVFDYANGQLVTLTGGGTANTVTIPAGGSVWIENQGAASVYIRCDGGTASATDGTSIRLLSGYNWRFAVRGSVSTISIIGTASDKVHVMPVAQP